MEITPSDTQAKAIAEIVKWYSEEGRQEFYLAGFAGTGKSTIANIAIEELKDRHGIVDVRVAAYTGKAASVLRSKGIDEAQTIHSLIYAPVVQENGDVTFELSEESDAAAADLIVLDECSMVDKALADDLRSFKKKILIMGDPGQLPPISGQGEFMNREPDFFLHEIHRQAADSPILRIATLAREGKFIPGMDEGGVKVLDLTKETQPLIYHEDTQPICGVNRVRWVYNMRIRAQRGMEGGAPQKGDRVICCKNNYRKGIFNGGMGRITKFRTDFGKHSEYIFDVDMDDCDGELKKLHVDPALFNQNINQNKVPDRLKIPGKKFNEFDWGYIITCHKAQGSQWPHVTVIDDSAVFRNDRAKWLYTAITRAETGLTLLKREN